MELKLNPETQEKICQLVRAGVTVEIAAESAGVSAATYYAWMAKGLDANSGVFHQFRTAIERARAEAEAVLVGRVQQAAAKGSWRAACWLLERQWPERWASLQEKDRAGSADLDRELDRILKQK